MSNKERKNIPVKKNNTYKVEVTDLSHQGLGVAHIEGYPLFIENALPGEELIIQISHVGKRMGHGEPLEIIKKSPYRVEELEDVHFQSGTMPLQHLEYEQQLKFKQQQVKKLLSKVGGIEDVPVFETIGMDHPYGYRNKAQIPVREIRSEEHTSE